MQIENKQAAHLEKINSVVELLSQTSEQIIYVMDEQIQAVISSSPEKIEELTERQSEIQSEYKKYEREFIVQLEKHVNEKGERDIPSLSDLKDKYPSSREEIERWKVMLSQNSKNLQRKNRQLVDLLEFALNRNTRLMHSYYTLFNRKNSHYSPTGQTASIASGVAVNQEV
ncbi:MAG: hypothetical protein R6V27_08355 [Balneolaceae bacterium]